jgi:hypothetical protein
MAGDHILIAKKIAFIIYQKTKRKFSQLLAVVKPESL